MNEMTLNQRTNAQTLMNSVDRSYEVTQILKVIQDKKIQRIIPFKFSDAGIFEGVTMPPEYPYKTEKRILQLETDLPKKKEFAERKKTESEKLLSEIRLNDAETAARTAREYTSLCESMGAELRALKDRFPEEIEKYISECRDYITFIQENIINAIQSEISSAESKNKKTQTKKAG